MYKKLIKIVALNVTLAAMLGCEGNKDEAASPEAASTQAEQTEARINPQNWPLLPKVFKEDPAVEAKIKDLLSRMSVEEKVGQIIQADIASVTPEEIKTYHLGSVLNGGNSAPKNDPRIEAQAWLDLADEYWLASMDTSDGSLAIPIFWGTDAVHGHNNIVGATIFPHNIGLGAANNPALMKKIGQVTAKEMLATGLDWTFAPTIAVVRDDRWGRTYESYSEHPDIVASYAGELVEGIQGKVGTPEFLNNDHMIATVKHFVGDGGTTGGRDQGNNETSEDKLRDNQAAGYPAAIQSGVQVVMASFSGYHGRKLHGYKELLTDVLVGRYNFDGFVVGDWNGHGQVKGCTNISCAASINAGLDMFMAPDSWRGLYDSTLAQAKSGEISAERLDQAVARVLRVKIRSGLFEAGLPSKRQYAGDWSLLASAEHKAVARDAVRQSLVLLKNNNALPIAAKSNILVTGDGANDIGKQSGGWTLSWQGTGNVNSDFPYGQSIYAGIAEAASAAGGSAVLSKDGSYDKKPDVAIVVFGEDPYAEFQGDVENLYFSDADTVALLKKYQAEGIKTVSVFLSGRPMWVNPEINASDAFVAAWLPGGQGGGIADVLLTGADGKARYDFTGKLSFSWPKKANHTAVNYGDSDYDPQFAYGYGLTYSDATELAELSEDPGISVDSLDSSGEFIRGGDAAGVWRMVASDAGGNTQITDAIAVSTTGVFKAQSADFEAQEDTRILEWSGPARFSIQGNGRDFSRESNGDMAIHIRYKVSEGEIGKTTMESWCSQGEDCRGVLDITDDLKKKAGQGWVESLVKLKCFEEAGADMTKIFNPLVLNSEGPLTIQIQSAALKPNTGAASCSL